MISYSSREERAAYTYKKYGEFLQGRILDVGCGDANLREFVSSEYIGIDITGKFDVLFNLELGKLPFNSNSFDCVVCTDVLEHLEKIHDMFFELARVTRKYVIISLPNNWNTLINRIFSLRGKDGTKYYGLTIEKPKDRHRWFFNYEEAKYFIYGMAEKRDMDVIVCEPYNQFELRRPFLNFLVKTILNEERYNNIFALALWTVLEKK